MTLVPHNGGSPEIVVHDYDPTTMNTRCGLYHPRTLVAEPGDRVTCRVCVLATAHRNESETA